MKTLENLLIIKKNRTAFVIEDAKGDFHSLEDGIKGTVQKVDTRIVVELLGEKPDINMIKPLVNALNTYYYDNKKSDKSKK